MAIAELDLSRLNGSNGFKINGIGRADFSGKSVSNAGDVNGDGIDDLIIGAPGADPNRKRAAGESYVVFGSLQRFNRSLNLSSLDGSNGFVINGIDQNDESGKSVSGAGDINGDGINDLIIGAEAADLTTNLENGESYVVFGSSDGFSQSLDLSSLDGLNGFSIIGIGLADNSGRSVSDAGDINGDGIDDLIIGAPGAASSRYSYSGETYVVFGSLERLDESLNLSDLDGMNGFVINGIDFGDSSGNSVSAAGDINGDGIDDIIIGAFSASPNGKFRAGESYVVFGSNDDFGSSLELSNLDGDNGFVINGVDLSDFSGFSVSGAGDINGDGIDDLIIGAIFGKNNEDDSAGVSYVVFGSTEDFEESFELSSLDGRNGFEINGIDGLDRSGLSVSGAGDINGDGIDDLIIGSLDRDGATGNTTPGESYVVFGSSQGFSASLELSSLDGRNGFVIKGIDVFDRSGFSVSGAGDINGDGIDDFVIGAYLADPNGNSSAGESYVIFGQRSFSDEGDRILGTSDSDTLKGTQRNDILLGKGGDDTLRGFAGDDRLFGNAGNDVLVGGRGNDRLIGGSGVDSLRGRDGEDKFIFQNVCHEADFILDFNAEEDFILISKSGFDLDLPKGRLANSRFSLGSSAQDRSDRLIYNDQTGALLFDPDGNRSQDAKAIAFLNPGQELNAVDIRIF